MESSHEVALGNFGIGPTSAAGRLIAVSLLFSKSMKEYFSALEAYIERWITFVLAASPHGTRSRFFRLNTRKPYLVFALFIGSAFFLWILRRPRAVRAKAQLVLQRQFWRNVMSGAYTYDEWAHAAKMLEKECGRRKDSDLYDEDLVRTKLQELRIRRKEGIMQDMLFCLRTDLVRNLGNMCNPELHMGRFQAPMLIREYIDEVRYHLRAVCDSDIEDLPLEEKLAFIRETRHAFGRTALLLSGGASLGAFHVGVVRTLIEHGLLPRVVAGASVGSIMCSVIATRNWLEVQTFFGDSLPTLQFFDQLGGIFAIVNRLFTRGVVHEIRKLQHMLRELTQNMTFQEAFDSTGRVLGISVCSSRKHEPARCLNYLTSPHVVIWSAVTASCAFPGLFEAQELMAKDRHGQLVPYHTPVQAAPEDRNLGVRNWRDGSLESDLPMVQLKELFNVNHFVVSQANPHIAPLLRLKDLIRKYGGDFAAKLAHLSEMEVKHRCNQIWEMGFPMGGIAKLFAQDWEGHVTIVMPATLAQFAKIIQNPTSLELQKAVNQGRKCTWEKLSAINANCGIELMLDECMSELNHRCREKKRLERNSLALVSLAKRASGAKRIPSWNCFARENSWGSLDEEAMVDSSSQGTATGGPPCNHHDGSDSESESIDQRYHSWTRAGGPLMRTSSATQFIQELQAADFISKVNKEDLPYLVCKDAGMEGSNGLLSLGSEQALRKEACNDVVFERSSTAEHDMGLPRSELDTNEPEQPCYGVAEASLREVLECAVTSDDERAQLEGQPLLKSLEHGAFGSFISKLDDFGSEK